MYPNPRRTIVVRHWNSEEQGLNGSGAYATDHPEVVEGIHALFNQDNGTSPVTSISAPGLLDPGDLLARWMGQLPDEGARNLRLGLPGSPTGGGSDHASFVCAGAPAFSLGSESWDHFSYTWHTNLDAFDKVVIDNVRWNAVLTAMLAYLAAEDPETISRERRVLGMDRRTGEPATSPACSDPNQVVNRQPP